MLSDGLWRSRYAADPGIIGRTLTLSGQPYTVIGVAPPGFTYPGNAVAWLPMEYGLGRSAQRSSHSYDVVGRLAPGVSLAAAQADLAAVARALEQENPVDNGGRGVHVVPLAAETVRAARPVLLLLGGAALFVLLIACANVANLFLARAAVRQRELAVRAALGAGRWRLARQVLVEGVLLSLAGGLIGLLLASWGVDLLLALRPRGIPRLDEIGVDHTTLAFAVLVSVMVGVGFALFPAITLSQGDPADAFRGEGRGVTGGRSGGRFRAALVVAQVSLALVLLAGAALLVVTVRRLALIDPGFDPRGAYTFEFTIPPGKYPDRARHDQYLTRVVDAVSRVGGTRAAGATFYLPLGNGQVNGDFTVAGAPPAAPGKEHYANFRMVTGDYFGALSIPLRRGRLFTPDDRAGAPHVAVVNEALARMAWPNQDPIGRRLTFGDGQDDPDWMEVVGVDRGREVQRSHRGRRAGDLRPLRPDHRRPLDGVRAASGIRGDPERRQPGGGGRRDPRGDPFGRSRSAGDRTFTRRRAGGRRRGTAALRDAPAARLRRPGAPSRRRGRVRRDGLRREPADPRAGHPARARRASRRRCVPWCWGRAWCWPASGSASASWAHWPWVDCWSACSTACSPPIPECWPP